MKDTSLLIMLYFLLLPCQVASQDFAFNHVNEQFGISMKDITAVVRDDDGFVWSASRTGILRTSAHNYRIYSLPFFTTDVMQVKLAYRKDLLVAATQNGQVFRYNRILDTFERWFTLSPQLSQEDWITNLLVDEDNQLWISTSTGIFIRSNEETKPMFQHLSGMSYITPLDKDHLWACMQSSFYCIHTHEQTCKQLQGHLPHLISSARYDAYRQQIWIGTYHAGLWQYDWNGQSLHKVTVPDFPALIVRDILIPDTCSLWAGIDGAGIWILDPQTYQVRHKLHENLDDPSSLRGNSVYSLLLDDQQQIWTATTSGGLQYTVSQPSVIEHLIHGIHNPQSLHNNEVNHILTDSEGNLWIATNNGISRRDAHTHKWKQLYGGRQLAFLSLTTDHQGHIYAGTYGEGVYVLKETDGREVHHYDHREGGIFSPGGFVFATYADSEGDVWMGGVKGDVVCYRPSNGERRTYPPQSVYCFAELSPGKILLGCAYELILMDKATGETEVLLSNRTVHDIAVVDHTIWICSSGDGVIGLDTRSGEQLHITTQQGLPSNYTKSMLLTDHDLWISTDNGLCCFNLVDKKIRTFAHQPLLTNESFNVDAACRLPDGRLAFGSNKGAILFHPEQLDTVSSLGRIYFSDIQVSGRSIRELSDFQLSVPIDQLSTLQLDYPQNSFTLSVLPLGHMSRSAGFSWKLTGQDKTWNAYSTNRYINYTNLPAGEYTLCIRLYDGSILAQRTLNIVVKPPFWHTLWFRLLLLSISIGLLGLGIRYYLQQLHRRYADEKIRFFTRMAHDMRTSLMLIKAPVEELHKEKALSAWGNQCLKLASEQATRLTDTATQLLDFEKLDVGREQPVFAPINIVDLIERRIQLYKAYAAGQQIELRAHFSHNDYWIEADARMMKRVVDNLLSNAVKYAKPNGNIEVTFTGTPNHWELRIKDDGIGISKAAQRKLFHEFYRSDNAVNAQIVGSGIGLLMTQKYLDMHQGKITVASALNEGSTFTICVPLRPASPQEIPTEANLTDDHTLMDTREETNVRDMHILIVEDNPTLREFMAHPLQEQFQVSMAHDGQEAWTMILQLQPDLVVSDIVMPHMDGFELCRLIKSTYETSHIPVILLTALSDKANQLHGLGLGADNYLVKPFDMALLASRIASIIRNRRTVFQKAIERQRNDSPTIVGNRMNDEFIKKAIECVRTNMSNEAFGKEEFAAALALSPSLLYKKIKALTHLSVVEFIRSIRLNYAMEKLRSGEFNVTEVSEMCGFNTPAYFSKVFKEYFGKTPTEVMADSQ